MAFKMIDVPFESKAGWVLRLDVDHTQKVNIGGQGQSPKEQRFLKYPCLNSLHCVIGLLHCIIGLVCLILDCHLNLNSNQEQYMELLI